MKQQAQRRAEEGEERRARPLEKQVYAEQLTEWEIKENKIIAEGM